MTAPSFPEVARLLNQRIEHHEAIKEPATCVGDRRHLRTDRTNSARLSPSGRFRAGKPQAATRNKRSVWTIATSPFPEAHFATFPPALVEPCILAGTSERGVCPNCGAPWQRVVKRVGGDCEARHRPKRTAGMWDSTSTLSLSGNGSNEWAERGTRSVTIGWRASCDCGPGDPVPALVLDPFLGAGTTALVADRLGRHCIGLELSPGHAEMAGRRTASAAANEKGRHRQSQRRPPVSLCGSLSQREPDANRRIGAGQISTAPRGPLPRRSHAQKIFSRNSDRGYGPDYYIQTFDFACFCRCQFDFLVSLLGSKTDDFTPFLS
jgi:hypothetical protein